MKKIFTPKNEGPKDFVINGKYYIVESCLAQGGFAIVYLVRNDSYGTKYALKRMFVNDEEKLGLCKQEIELTKKFSGHKNTIEYHDSIIQSTGHGVYEVIILLKYYKNNVIDEMIKRNGKYFSEDEVMRIFCGVCEAVAHLHHSKPPVIHRDLKVENLLLDESNTCILCDFGSATTRVLNPSTDGTLVVEEQLSKYTTLSYRSPEMVDLFLNKNISTKSDIWALGCLLYKLCYFMLPFQESVLLISSVNFSIPVNNIYSDNLLRLMGYMFNKDPDLRPDIFQVSYLAFQLIEKKCPVFNVENSMIPVMSCLPLPLSINDKIDTSSRFKNHTKPNVSVASFETTSISKRQRPRANMTNIEATNLNTQPALTSLDNLATKPTVIVTNGSKDSNLISLVATEMKPSSKIVASGNSDKVESCMKGFVPDELNLFKSLGDTAGEPSLIDLDSVNVPSYKPVFNPSFAAFNPHANHFNYSNTYQNNPPGNFIITTSSVPNQAFQGLTALSGGSLKSLYNQSPTFTNISATGFNAQAPGRGTLLANDGKNTTKNMYESANGSCTTNNPHMSYQNYTRNFNPSTRPIPHISSQSLAWKYPQLGMQPATNEMAQCYWQKNKIGSANRMMEKSGSTSSSISSSMFAINDSQIGPTKGHRRNMSDNSSIKMSSIYHPQAEWNKINNKLSSWDPFENPNKHSSCKTAPSEDIFGDVPFNPTTLQNKDSINLLDI